jgi:hypothetical protein
VLGVPQWGAAIPVDPGKYLITATAPGLAPWQIAVEVLEEATQATVEVPVLERPSLYFPYGSPGHLEHSFASSRLGFVPAGDRSDSPFRGSRLNAFLMAAASIQIPS